MPHIPGYTSLTGGIAGAGNNFRNFNNFRLPGLTGIVTDTGEDIEDPPIGLPEDVDRSPGGVGTGPETPTGFPFPDPSRFPGSSPNIGGDMGGEFGDPFGGLLSNDRFLGSFRNPFTGFDPLSGLSDFEQNLLSGGPQEVIDLTDTIPTPQGLNPDQTTVSSVIDPGLGIDAAIDEPFEIEDPELRDTDNFRGQLFDEFGSLVDENANEMAKLNAAIAQNQLAGFGASIDAATQREAARLGIQPGTPQFRQLQERNKEALLSRGSNLMSTLASQNLANQRANLVAGAGFLQGQQGTDIRESLAFDQLMKNPALSTGQVQAIKGQLGDVIGQPGFADLPEESQVSQVTKWLQSLGVQNPQAMAEQIIGLSLQGTIQGLQGAVNMTGGGQPNFNTGGSFADDLLGLSRFEPGGASQGGFDNALLRDTFLQGVG